MKKAFSEFAIISALWIILPFSVKTVQLIIAFEISKPEVITATYLIGGLLSFLIHMKLRAKNDPFYNQQRIVVWQTILYTLFAYAILVGILVFLTPNVRLEGPYLLKLIISNLAIIGFVEELVFRGMLLNNAMELWRDRYIAILTVSIIFSSAHLAFLIASDTISPLLMILKFISSFILSVAMCLVYQKKNSILLCVALHAGQNIIVNLAFINPALGLVLYAIGYSLIFIIIRSHPRIEANNQ